MPTSVKRPRPDGLKLHSHRMRCIAVRAASHVWHYCCCCLIFLSCGSQAKERESNSSLPLQPLPRIFRQLTTQLLLEYLVTCNRTVRLLNFNSTTVNAYANLSMWTIWTVLLVVCRATSCGVLRHTAACCGILRQKRQKMSHGTRPCVNATLGYRWTEVRLRERIYVPDYSGTVAVCQKRHMPGMPVYTGKDRIGLLHSKHVVVPDVHWRNKVIKNRDYSQR